MCCFFFNQIFFRESHIISSNKKSFFLNVKKIGRSSLRTAPTTPSTRRTYEGQGE